MESESSTDTDKAFANRALRASRPRAAAAEQLAREHTHAGERLELRPQPGEPPVTARTWFCSACCAGAARARSWFCAKDWSQRILVSESYG
jgi:hypothetical protein